jgi:hypothetical protein
VLRHHDSLSLCLFGWLIRDGGSSINRDSGIPEGSGFTEVSEFTEDREYPNSRIAVSSSGTRFIVESSDPFVIPRKVLAFL